VTSAFGGPSTLALTRARRKVAIAGAIGVILGVVVLLACAPTQYVYAPVRTTAAEIGETTAAVHFAPPDAPRGDLRVGVVGIDDLPPQATSGLSRTAMHQAHGRRAIRVRVLIANRSDERWTFHGSEQRIVAGRADLRAQSEALDVAPSIDIAPGARETVDLLFPLPASLERPNDLAAFDLVWTLHLGGRVHTERTAFERFLADGRAPSVLTRSEDTWKVK
jgi:hypothetical protein